MPNCNGSGLRNCHPAAAIDTLMIARRRFPGSPASLDALCRRFGIDNSNRTLHGALLDSEILAEVYLELTGGRQPDFAIRPHRVRMATRRERCQAKPNGDARPRKTPLAPRITEEERAAHSAFVAELGDGAIWSRFD